MGEGQNSSVRFTTLLEVRSFPECCDSVRQVLVVVCCGLENWDCGLKGYESSWRCHMIGCVCVCHGATCSLRPLQSAGESVPAELRGGVLPRKAGRRVPALSQGLRYLCRWEHRSRGQGSGSVWKPLELTTRSPFPSIFVFLKSMFAPASLRHQVQVSKNATTVQKATWWRSGGVCPPAVPASTPQSQTQR